MVLLCGLRRQHSRHALGRKRGLARGPEEGTPLRHPSNSGPVPLPGAKGANGSATFPPISHDWPGPVRSPRNRRFLMSCTVQHRTVRARARAVLRETVPAGSDDGCEEVLRNVIRRAHLTTRTLSSRRPAAISFWCILTHGTATFWHADPLWSDFWRAEGRRGESGQETRSARSRARKRTRPHTPTCMVTLVDKGYPACRRACA